MHIPDNYLSPSTCAAAFAAAVPVWAVSLKKAGAELPKDRIPLLGVGAAFAFLFMMFNVPLPGGTSGHAVGGTLLAVLLGPWAACLSLSAALLLQALLFGDGGVLSYGANCLNMAVVLPFTGYFVYRMVADRAGSGAAGGKLRLAGAALGAYVGLNASAFFAAVEFGLQPLLFRGDDGLPLYCPYPLAVSLPAMMLPHLSVAGFVEAAFTASVLAFLAKAAPDLAAPAAKPRLGPVYVLLAVLVLASPLGLLAAGTAWGEWGADEIASAAAGGKALGFVPAGLAHGFSLKALLPDYSFPGLGAGPGYALCAVAGAALLVIAFKLAGLSRSGGDSR